MAEKYSGKSRSKNGRPSSRRQRSLSHDTDNSKQAMLDRRHMLDIHRDVIAAQWDHIQRFQDPVYMVVDANSRVGQVIARQQSQEDRAHYATAKSAIPTVQRIHERASALAPCRDAGFQNVAATLMPCFKGAVVPVIVVASGGLMNHSAGGPGCVVHSRQAIEEEEID
jgi:hypothetical protein